MKGQVHITIPRGGGGGTGDTVTWSNVTGKPSTYPPSTHNHTTSQITDFPNMTDYALVSDVDTAIDEHDGSATAHEDIRDSIDDKISDHNEDSTAHEDIRDQIEDKIVDHNEDTSAHEDIRDMIPTSSDFIQPSIEMYIGHIGTQSSEISGVFLRIINPECLQPNDIVLFRHSVNRHYYSDTVAGKARYTKRRNKSYMAMINGANDQNPTVGNGWFRMYPPIQGAVNIANLSQIMGDGNYKFIKVGELPSKSEMNPKPPFTQSKPILINTNGSRFYFSGNNRVSKHLLSVPYANYEKNTYNVNTSFALFDAIIFRPHGNFAAGHVGGKIVAKSEQYLLFCRGVLPTSPVGSNPVYKMSWRIAKG